MKETMHIRLVFVSEAVIGDLDVSYVNESLNVQPDSEKLSNRSWSYSGVRSSSDECVRGTFIEWQQFLRDKREGFEKIRIRGYQGYLELKVLDLDHGYIDSSFVKLLGELGLGICYWIPQKHLDHA